MFHGLGFRVDDLGFRVEVFTICFFFVKGIQKVINVFYSLLKMRVKTVSVNMKSGNLKIVFLAISQNNM